MRLFALFSFFIVAATLLNPATAQESTEDRSENSELSATDIAAVQQFGDTLGIAEWLGPLAPVALSPFFGITCLSGMSLFGQGWIAQDNAFLGEASPLHHPAVFWIFLGLTLLTSIPRFTKVSKPLAQAVDHVEAWSGIITMIVLKFLLSAGDLPAEQPDLVQLGVFSVTTDVLLASAAALNIFVINAIKFFFEMLIWITPVPAIDAIFELSNKTACGLLMAIYGYSPMIATAINAVMFLIAAIMFRWVYRREIFFRTMLLDAVLALFFPRVAVEKNELYVFPATALGPIPARARCVLRRADIGWTVTQQTLLSSNTVVQLEEADCRCQMQPGWFTNSMDVSGTTTAQLTFSRRFNGCLAELAEAMNANLNENSGERGKLQAELA